MTHEPLFTVSVGTTLEQAQEELHKHRVEKLLVVDENFALKGLITVKDIQKKRKYPNATKDEKGRLRVGAAIGATGDFLERAQELVSKKVDVLVIDTAHGHSERVMQAVVAIKRSLPNVDVVAGNVATYDGARDLIALGLMASRSASGRVPSVRPASSAAPVYPRSPPSRSARGRAAVPVFR